MRPFLGAGLGRVCADGMPKSRSVEPAENGTWGFPKALALLLDDPGREGSLSSEARRLRMFVGEGS